MIASTTITLDAQAAADAEQSLAACVMLAAESAPAIVGEILAAVDDADLADPAVRLVFTAARALVALGVPPTVDKVFGWIKEAGRLGTVGDRPGLDELREATYSPLTWRGHAATVRRIGKPRRIAEAFHLGQRDVEASGGDPATIAAAVQRVTVAAAEAHAVQRPITARELMVQHPTMADEIVFGMVRRGELMTGISTAKGRKSWAYSLDLGIAMATGAEWLGFKVAKGRAVIVDMELAGATLARRFRHVEEARGVNLDDVGDRVRFLTKRGQRYSIDELERETLDWKPGDCDLLILDPLYRLYPPGHDENDNAAAALLMARLIGIATRLACAVVIIHHLAKGPTDGRRLVDLGAGAGAVARAGDVHAVIKPDEGDADYATFECVVRSFPPVKPLRLHWHDYQWHASDAPAALPWTVARLAAEFVGAEPASADSIIAKAVDAGCSKRNARELLMRGVDAGMVLATTAGRRTLYRRPPEHDSPDPENTPADSSRAPISIARNESGRGGAMNAPPGAQSEPRDGSEGGAK